MTDSANVQTVTVDKLVYILLAFFLGALGVHKFYAGHISSMQARSVWVLFTSLCV